VYHYFAFHQAEWLVPEKTKLREQGEQCLGDMLVPYLHYFAVAPEGIIISECQKYNINASEIEPLRNWLKSLQDSFISRSAR
jgi:hypothetical protein